MSTKNFLRFFYVCFFTMVVVTAPAFADTSEQAARRNRVIDNAGILGPQQRETLAGRLDVIAREYAFELVIVIENSIGGRDPQEYAENFFDYHGYGLGTDRSGGVFLLVIEDRDYYINTTGKGLNILTPHAWDKLQTDSVKLLREGKYVESFYAFANNWERFLRLDANGKKYNFLRRYHLTLVAAAWVLALVIGFGVVRFWKRGMSTVFPKTRACEYAVPGSLGFKEKKDRFLYSTVTKTAQPKSQGGNKSPIAGSSGSRHGGRGGKF